MQSHRISFQSQAWERDENSNNGKYRLIYFANMTHFSNISLNTQASYILFSVGKLIQIKKLLEGFFDSVNFPNVFKFGIIFSRSCMPRILHNQGSKVPTCSQTHSYHRKLLEVTFHIYLEPSDLKNQWCISKLKQLHCHSCCHTSKAYKQLQWSNTTAFRQQTWNFAMHLQTLFLAPLTAWQFLIWTLF